MFTMRNYLLVGIAFGAITFLMMQLFGDDFAQWAREFEADAQIAGSGGFGDLVTSPFKVMGENPIIAGVVVGLVWPLVFIWGAMTGILALIILLG